MRERIRKIIATKCVVTASPIGEERYKPGYGKYSSITIEEKQKFETICTLGNLKPKRVSHYQKAGAVDNCGEQVKNQRNQVLNDSWEQLLRKVSEARASQRIF